MVFFFMMMLVAPDVSVRCHYLLSPVTSCNNSEKIADYSRSELALANWTTVLLQQVRKRKWNYSVRKPVRAHQTEHFAKTKCDSAQLFHESRELLIGNKTLLNRQKTEREEGDTEQRRLIIQSSSMTREL